MYETFDDSWKRWLAGIAAPLIFIGFGIYAIINRQFHLNFLLWLASYILQGGAAIAAGMAMVAMGIGAYAWYWWEDKEQFDFLRTILVVGSGILFGICALIAALFALGH